RDVAVGSFLPPS
nr:RecName: Full=Unknown protein from spot 111 of 2D-PAGE of thylakoid [Pisum sativum]